jgi:hypothetical protein
VLQLVTIILIYFPIQFLKLKIQLNDFLYNLYIASIGARRKYFKHTVLLIHEIIIGKCLYPDCYDNHNNIFFNNFILTIK